MALDMHKCPLNCKVIDAKVRGLLIKNQTANEKPRVTQTQADNCFPGH